MILERTWIIRDYPIALENHRDCTCSYCKGGLTAAPLHLGINWPECKRANSWVVIHWRWRGASWYFRFCRGRLFGVPEVWPCGKPRLQED